MKKIWLVVVWACMLCGCNDAKQETENTVQESIVSASVDSTETTETTEEIKSVVELSNPNADEVTKEIYQYLYDLSGSNVLSGQQESTWMGSVDYEMDYIFEKTGKYPAMRGFDYMHDDFEGVHERAVKWWDEGGLVTICWHTGYDFNGEWVESMNTQIDDWDAVLTEGTPEYEAFVAGMDKAAQALLKLQDEGVTVLWRPFHELDGEWFWWGKGGSENFKKLWILMYDRYTNHWGLNNLIWVLGFSGNGRNYDKWYPGDEYVDVIGADSYNGGAQGTLYTKAKAVTSAQKPMCFHECGVNPTVAELQKVHWVWFMTWHTDYVTDKNKPNDLDVLYNSDYVITRDELPQFNK